MPLVNYLSRTDGTHDPDPEAWPILHFYRRLFGFWPNTMAYLYRWPTAYKLFVYCQNIASLPKARETVGTPVVSIGLRRVGGTGCTYCMTYAITLFRAWTSTSRHCRPRARATPVPTTRSARSRSRSWTWPRESPGTPSPTRPSRPYGPPRGQARAGAADPDEAVEAVTQISSSMGFFNVFNDLAGLATEGDMARVARSKGIDSGRHAVEDKNPDNLSHDLPAGGPTIEEMFARYGSAVGDLTAYTTEHLGLTPACSWLWP